jgi:hypothetical protein
MLGEVSSVHVYKLDDSSLPWENMLTVIHIALVSVSLTDYEESKYFLYSFDLFIFRFVISR